MCYRVFSLLGDPQYRYIKFSKADGDCLRVGDIVTAAAAAAPGLDTTTVSISILVPGEDKWIFWNELSLDLERVKKLEGSHEAERAAATMLLVDYDFVIFARVCGYFRSGTWHDVGERQLTGGWSLLGRESLLRMTRIVTSDLLGCVRGIVSYFRLTSGSVLSLLYTASDDSKVK